jgi:Ice-binding-like
MHVHNVPKRLARAFVAPRFAAGVVVTLALLSAACGRDSASRITAPSLSASMDRSPTATASAASGQSLGGAAIFAVLGGTSVTCTGSSVTGNVGVSPGVSVTGFPSTSTLCTLLNGTVHVNDGAAQLASANFLTAYDALAGMPCLAANHLSGDLVGMTLASGVYCFSTTAGLTGQLTLTGSGPWIFQIGTGLTTSTGATGPASVVTGNPCNVFWQVGSKATIGTGTAFQGNILAGTAIEFSGTGSSLVGRALAKAEVTMTGTNVTGCVGNNGGGNGNGNGDGNDDGDHGHGDKDHGDKDHGDKGHGDKGHDSDNHKSDGHSDREGGH